MTPFRVSIPRERRHLRRDPDQGTAALELAISMIGWVVALIVLATAYRMQTANDDVADAAGLAARAAAITATPGDATTIARTTAKSRLSSGACTPGSVAVLVDVAHFRAGGNVQVTVSCHSRPLLGASRTLKSTGDEPIDRYRGGL